MKVNFSIRLSPDQKARLQALARRLDLDPADLIRFAIRALLVHAAAHEGRILLPIDFDETFKVVRENVDIEPSWKDHLAAETPPEYGPKSSGSGTTSKETGAA